MKPYIRYAQNTDIPILTRFQQQMAYETELLELDEPTLSAGIRRVFDEPSKGKYYTAIINVEIVGSMMTTYEWSDWRNKTVWWIQSVYVRPEFRKMGIFRALFDYVHALALNDPEVGGLRLYVDKTNTNAQATYQKMGMNGEHYQVFELMKMF